jgi:hypothetical protein
MSDQKRTARRSSPGNGPRRTQTPPKEERYDDQLQVALEHKSALDAEYASLAERRAQLDAEIDRVQKLANQVVGRIDVIQELRGEREPLLSVSEVQKRVEAAQKKAQNGTSATARPTRSRAKAKAKGARGTRGGK